MTEDDLSRKLADKIVVSPEFVDWILGRTKFAEHKSRVRILHDEQFRQRPRKEWWRHWWLQMPDGEQRETDIFIVFEAAGNGERFALNIENKTIDREFEDGQAESYRKMASCMMDKEKRLKYSNFETLLIAPLAFRSANEQKCQMFDRYISHEDIAAFIPEFGNSNTT